MDTVMEDQQNEEATLEHELMANERVIEHPTLGKVKFHRPTPRQTALIAEERRKQQHADLRNPDVLSRIELEGIAVSRGIWSPEEEETVTELSQKMGKIMGILDNSGYQTLDKLISDFVNTVEVLREHFKEDDDLVAVVDRYFDLDVEPEGKDHTLIFAKAGSTEVDELLEKGVLLRRQIKQVEDLTAVRKELNKLQEKQALLFMDSVEARAQRVERLASLYHCAKMEDDSPLSDSLESFKDFTADEIEFLMEEYFYFENGITDEFKDLLGRHGFIQRLTDTDEESEDSPDQPQSNSDGESPEKTPETSGTLPDTTSTED